MSGSAGPPSESPLAVVALVDDREARARVERGLAGFATVRFCTSRDVLLDMAPDADVVLVQPRDRSGAPVAVSVATLRRRRPSLPIVALCWLTPADCRDLIALAKAGVDEVVLRGHDDPSVTLRRALAGAEQRRTAADLMPYLSSFLPAEMEAVLAYCVAHAREPLSVARIADALGVHRRTLVNWSARAGLPSPAALVAWSRLLVAAHLLDRGATSVEQVALTLGFSSGAGLRKMLRTYTGLTPGEVRENGGAKCVAHAFGRATGVIGARTSTAR